ncbi:hypothetical protein SDC9_147056 [bioreactor metagenome]|uniref:Uncharacterized protein n=1 Tax=bioreactor metagenome TaxID=1076179 RepID=A0A645EF00_9ZZZZ
MFLDHISVEICQRNPHTLSVFFSSTENDGFVHPAHTLQVFRNLPCHLICAVFKNDVIVKIAVGIDTIFDFLTVLIKLSFIRTPAFAYVGTNIDYLEWGKKTVLNALTQTIGVNWLTKIINIGNIFCFLRRCCHADLCGRRKVIEYLPPVAVLLCRTSMTLIYNYKVKKILLEQLSKPADGFIFAVLAIFILTVGKLLIQRKVNLVRSDGDRVIFCKIDFVDRLFKWSKVLLNRLIDKNVAVSQI